MASLQNGIQLALTDSGTGQTIMARISLHDAKQLYKCLREIFGDAAANPALPFSIPDIDVGSQLIGHLPEPQEEKQIIVV